VIILIVHPSASTNFRELEAEVTLPRRPTMTPAMDQEEAKDRGFPEEAPARPGGRYLEGIEFPARKEELLGRLERNGVPPGPRPAAQEAPGRRVPRPPGRLVGSATGPQPAAGVGCGGLEVTTGKRPRKGQKTNFEELYTRSCANTYSTGFSELGLYMTTSPAPNSCGVGSNSLKYPNEPELNGPESE
jgi:hypothetical protein